MKLLCDEDVEQQIVARLRTDHHDVVYIAELSPGITDEHVLELAGSAESLLPTVAFLVLIRAFLVQTFVIVSGSKEDTLLVGDFLMVNRLALGTPIPGTDLRTPGYSEPNGGDVLVFDPPHEEGIKLVKRLVDMPGDGGGSAPHQRGAATRTVHEVGG